MPFSEQGVETFCSEMEVQVAEQLRTSCQNCGECALKAVKVDGIVDIFEPNHLHTSIRVDCEPTCPYKAAPEAFDTELKVAAIKMGVEAGFDAEYSLEDPLSVDA